MENKIIVALLATMLLTSCYAFNLSSLTAKADATSRTIIVPDDFPTIQEAVSNATAGDTVYVRAGNYTIPPNWADYELEIPRSVSLIGENPQNTIIETTQIHRSIFGWNYGIGLNDDSSISGFTITGNVKVLMGHGRITNNIIKLAANGERAICTSTGIISSNIICCVAPESLSQGTASGTIGIATSDPNGNTVISNNIINGFGTGIESLSNGLKIFNNTLTINEIGVFIQRSPILLIRNNFESSNGCGLLANGGTNATYNWWGTNDTQAVSRAITTTGYNQDIDGKVFFEPYLNAPNPQAIPIKPNVVVIFPVDQKYNESSVPLTFVVDKPVSSMQYSLDGQQNVTVDGNLTLTGLSNGVHNVTVYAKDALGGFAASETVQFSVSSLDYLIVPVAGVGVASAVAFGVGLTYYLKKRSLRCILLLL